MISQRILKGFIIFILVGAIALPYLVRAQQPSALSSNLQIFSGLARPQLMQVMREWSAALGVDCRYCHQDSYEAETPRKEIARRMQRDYVAALKQRDGSAVNCQTCHQGKAKLIEARAPEFGKPSAGNPVLRALRVPLKSAGVGLWRASTKVSFLPKKHFMEEMRSFNQALGVNCRYCHKKGDFEADTLPKQTARLMRKEFSAKLLKQNGQPVSCNDCHQGKTRLLAHLR